MATVNKDNKNNTLSQEQVDFFKDSKIRNSKGQLLVCYHGTNEKNILVFKSKINWFSISEDYAKIIGSLSNDERDWSFATIYTCYLNCKRLFIVGDTNQRIYKSLIPTIKDYSSLFQNVINRLHMTKEQVNELIKISSRETNKSDYALQLFDLVRRDYFADIVKSKGYDCIVTREEGHTCFGVLEKNEIKLISNQEPSNKLEIDEVWNISRRGYDTFFNSNSKESYLQKISEYIGYDIKEEDLDELENIAKETNDDELLNYIEYYQYKFESLNESKQDELNFKNWILKDFDKNTTYSKEDKEKYAQDYVNRFLKIKSRLKSPQNDYYYWIKQPDTAQFLDLLYDIEDKETNKEKEKKAKEGAKLIYKDDRWQVYHITSYEASVKYGKNTKWCITGTQRWNGKTGQQFFDDYYQNGDNDLFFFIDNKTNTKYCFIVYAKGNTEIRTDTDNTINYIPDAPKIEAFFKRDERFQEYYKEKENDFDKLIKVISNEKLDTNIEYQLSKQVIEKYINEADYEEAIWLYNFEDFCNAGNELIPDGYLEYEAVADDRETIEWYKEITGEEYTNKELNGHIVGWDGDMPLINVYSKVFKETKSTREEQFNESNIVPHKYYWIYPYQSDDVDTSDDFIGLSMFVSNLLERMEEDYGHISYVFKELNKYATNNQITNMYNLRLSNYENIEKFVILCAFELYTNNVFEKEKNRILNSTNESLNESLQEVDSEGNPLSQEQINFFKNSKIRDKQGRLLVCYHGTSHKFSHFVKGDVGFHFGTKTQSESRINSLKTLDYNMNIPERRYYNNQYYLNIKHPLVIDYDMRCWDALMFFTHILNQLNYLRDATIDLKITPQDRKLILQNVDIPCAETFKDENSYYYEFVDNYEQGNLDSMHEVLEIVDEWLEEDVLPYNSKENKFMRKFLQSKGFDGIKYLNEWETNGEESPYSYIVFESNQVKSTDNKNPSNSNKINETK